MTAYRVVVTQSLHDGTDGWKDASFVQYVITLLEASYIVKRFDSCSEAEQNYRRVTSINIETIHIQTK